MRTNIFLLRHAQSQANMLNIVQGRGLLIPLTEKGAEQARNVAKALKNLMFDRIFTSTALRAVHTAAAIRKYHPTPYEEIFELNELSKGNAEGMSIDNFAKRYPEIIEQWSRGVDVRSDGGENFSDVEARVIPVLERHLIEHAGKNLLYVIHGNVIRVIIGYILGVPYGRRARIQQDYCALTALEYDNSTKRWLVKFINQALFNDWNRGEMLWPRKRRR
ncbi:MAG: histidine phosphatase family protein [Candidatus Niyogibacteria bacterium]|nr:histidine phosphatase family protein [Candidatus Niyogibacteria bacterium]